MTGELTSDTISSWMFLSVLEAMMDPYYIEKKLCDQNVTKPKRCINVGTYSTR